MTQLSGSDSPNFYTTTLGLKRLQAKPKNCVKTLSHKVIFSPLPEPNTELGASNLQEVKCLQDLPGSRTCLPVALLYVIRDCQKFRLHNDFNGEFKF